MRKTRKLLTAAMCALVLALGVNATLAYLTDSAEVENTFTVGNVGIDLYEHDYDPDANELGEKKVTSNSDYKMVPGVIMPKDPVVTVDAGSEDCWLFVEATEANEIAASGARFLTWSVDAEVWTKLEADAEGNQLSNVWFAVYDADANPSVSEFNVLAGKAVTVNPGVTKGDMDALEAAFEESDESVLPTLTFTAYAVQKAGVADAAAAWGMLDM